MQRSIIFSRDFFYFGNVFYGRKAFYWIALGSTAFLSEFPVFNWVPLYFLGVALLKQWPADVFIRNNRPAKRKAHLYDDLVEHRASRSSSSPRERPVRFSSRSLASSLFDPLFPNVFVLFESEPAGMTHLPILTQ